MSELLIIRTIAKVQFNNQIDKGNEFIAKIDNVGEINNQDELHKALENEVTWSQENDSMLRTIFDDTLLAEEYVKIEASVIDSNQSLMHNKNSLRDTIKRKVDWLSSLLNRLDDIPESVRVPNRGPIG